MVGKLKTWLGENVYGNNSQKTSGITKHTNYDAFVLHEYQIFLSSI